MQLTTGQCEVCRQWSAAGALCTACTERFGTRPPRCARCGLRLGLHAPACGACLREPPPFERTVCAVDYGFPWAGLIAAFKFHDRPELARALAPLLARAVHDAGGVLPGLVLPVPLAAARLAQRGYNQAWELARHSARLLGLAADATLLLRHRGAPHAQAELSRDERRRSLKQAFMADADARRRARLKGQRVALVDDVMTTGATVREAATALLRGGAAAVDVWVLARTPDD